MESKHGDFRNYLLQTMKQMEARRNRDCNEYRMILMEGPTIRPFCCNYFCLYLMRGSSTNWLLTFAGFFYKIKQPRNAIIKCNKILLHIECNKHERTLKIIAPMYCLMYLKYIFKSICRNGANKFTFFKKSIKPSVEFPD